MTAPRVALIAAAACAIAGLVTGMAGHPDVTPLWIIACVLWLREAKRR